MKQYFQRKFLQERVTTDDYLAAFVLAIMASGIVFGLEHLTVENFSNLTSALILAVMISAILLGKGPAILTATLCSLLYDWLMVPPFFGLPSSGDNIIKFSTFVTVALLTSAIAGLTKTYAIELKHRERELMHVIHEKEQYKREIEEQSVKRKAETLRNAILASVSHDLKTPLAAIIGAISSMQSYGPTLGDEDRSRLLSSVAGEANKLLGYVNNLLEVAKLEESQTIMKKEVLALDDILDLTIKRLSPILRYRRIEVRGEIASLAMVGDERLMDVALGNILDNAVKFSPEHSLIIVTLRKERKGNQLAILIEDEGVGVPESEAEKVFDKFYRARREDAKNTGTGLGLWISQRIIEAHQGKIRLEGRGRKPGTAVVITLPAAAITWPAQELAVSA